MHQGPKHICNILKVFHKRLYRYLKDNNVEKEILVNIRSLLHHVLVSNQLIANTLTFLLKKELTNKIFYQEYPKGVFPKYLRDNLHIYVKLYGDKINEKIIKIPSRNETPTDLKKYSNKELLDLTIPYKKIISIIRKNNLKSFYDRAEYGYFVGSILNINFKEYEKKTPIELWPKINLDLLEKRNKKLIYSIERSLYKKSNNNNKLKENFIEYEEENEEEEEKCTPIK